MKALNNQSRNAEIADVAIRISELFKQDKSIENDTFLKELIAEIEEKANELTESSNTQKSIGSLVQADKERDIAIRRLAKILKGYESIPLDDIQIHAKKLTNAFKRFGTKMLEENYSVKSTLIKHLILEFSSEDNKESVDELTGVRQMIEEIRTTQTNFDKIRFDNESAMALKKSKLSATQLKKPILEAINKKMVPYLIAMEISQPNLYKRFANKVSETINSTNEAVKLRSKKEKKTT